MTEYRVCSKCGVEKEENEVNFRLCKYANGTTYFKSFCRSCEKQVDRDFARKHKEERKQYQREYVKKNPQYIKRWKIDNKKHIRQQEKERRATDINFRLKKNVSRSIGHALNRAFLSKNGASTIKNLPYTLTELKEHLEKQFDNKMSWDNYGTYWHIDYIVPHSEFKYTSMQDIVFQECWALSNLRPLEARQNMIDGASRARHKK